MQRVFIKYNPYKVATEMTIDDKPLQKNNRLYWYVHDKRIQEWVDDLPDLLYEECNCDEFELIFYGTIHDFETIVAMSDKAEEKSINIWPMHIPAKEVKDKEQAIEEVFSEIRKGPFEELKQPDVVRAFEMARSSCSELYVVGSMSAGKTTLINSLLGQKLIPTEKEVCSTTITEIRNNDSDHFSAKVYDKSGKLIQSFPVLTSQIMEGLDTNPVVYRIRVEGDIPFVSSGEVPLVLVDSPGPNNARESGHNATMNRLISKSSNSMVLYVMNASQLATNDDYTLLKHVVESMRLGGKQPRESILFVINKMDELDPEEDDIGEVIDVTKKYIASFGIEDPQLFPCSAYAALNIRTHLKDDDVENLTRKEERELPLAARDTLPMIDAFLEYKSMHLENYSTLSSSAQREINSEFREAENAENIKEQALIHSGIVSVEHAISMYVAKNAQIARIKRIVNTLIKEMERARLVETTKKEVSSYKKERDAISRKKLEEAQSRLNWLDMIQNKLNAIIEI